MIVLCSGEKFTDPIDHRECIECAMHHDGPAPCGFIFPVIAAIFEGQEDRTNEVHVTDLIGCLRKAAIDKTSPSPQYVHDLMFLMIGRAVHDYIERSSKKYSSEWKFELPFSVDGYTGRVDSISPDGSVFDFKTTRSITPYLQGNHEQQVNAYMNGVGASSGWVTYIDVNGPQKCKTCKTSFILKDGEIVCRTCGASGKHMGVKTIAVEKQDTANLGIRSYILNSFLMDSEILPEPEPSWLCRFCKATKDQCPEAMK